MGYVDQDSVGTMAVKGFAAGAAHHAVRPLRWQASALLLLLGVKRGLLSLHFLYQFFDPIERKLVGYRRGYPLVMLDLSVEFQAFVTHDQFRICAYLPIIQPAYRPFVQIRPL
jgi:hypothetical protein